MAPQGTQDQALTSEQRRRLIHQIYQVILADGGRAAPPPAQEMPLDAEAAAAPAEAIGDDDRPVAEEAGTRPRRRAA